MNIEQFEVKEGSVVYVVKGVTCEKWFLKKIDMSPTYPLGFCLKTDDQYLKHFTMSWSTNWKEHVGRLYFLSEEDAKAHIELKNINTKNYIMNLSREELVNELYNGYLGDNDRTYTEQETMKDKLELEFGIRPTR